MKTKKLGMIVCILAGWFILSVTSNCLATTGNVLRTQGLINPGGNLKVGYLLINEMRVHIDKVTQVMDQYGVSISAAELKPKGWVYIEIEKDPVKKIVKARKIYLLPRYVKPAEKRRFSFMK